jgi:hypothetical protein
VILRNGRDHLRCLPRRAVAAGISVGRIDDGAWRGVLVGSAVGFFGPFFSGKAGR